MSAQDFFRDLRAALTHTLRTQGEATRTEAVLLQAWGAYELNHTLVLALDQPDSHAGWLKGNDPSAAAAVDMEQRAAMAADFDTIAH